MGACAPQSTEESSKDSKALVCLFCALCGIYGIMNSFITGDEPHGDPAWQEPNAELYRTNIGPQTFVSSNLRGQMLQRERQISAFTWPPTPGPGPKHDAPAPVDTSSSDSLKSAGKVAPSGTVPAVMMAVASSIIVCAVALYVADLRDRCRHAQRFQGHQRKERDFDGSKQMMETLAPSGGYWISSFGSKAGRNVAGHNGAFPMLPPSEHAPDDDDFVEEISISPVSTMTASCVMENCSLNRMDSDVYLSQSVEITELSEGDRVSGGTDLSSLVNLSRIHTIAAIASECTSINESGTTDERGDSSRRIRIDDTIYIMSDDEEDESGWTSVGEDSDASSEVSIGTYLRSVHSGKSRSSSVFSNEASSKTPSKARRVDLYGELYSNEEAGCSVAASSLERSPDSPHQESLVAMERDDLVQLTQLCEFNKTDRLRETKERKLSLLEALLERGRTAMQALEGTSLDESTEIDDSTNQEYVRNIFFVRVCPPSGTANSLGIDLEDSSCATGHPSVRSIHGQSPLRGSVFVGDVILAINNRETAGLGGQETGKLAQDGNSEASDVVKLTVISSNPDGSDAASDSDQVSMDTGIESTAIEV